MTARPGSWRRPSGLALHVGFNGVAQIAPIVVAFALTPLLLHRLGLDRFGIWSLALVVLATLTTLDGGVSASLARFFALYAAREERGETARLLLGALLLFAALALVLSLAAYPLVPAIVPLLHIPRALEDEAVMMLRWIPLLSALALASDSTAALLKGSGRFRSLAVAMLASTGSFAVAVVVLVQPGPHLGELVIATALRYVVLALACLLMAARQLSIRRPLLPVRATRRELWRYSSRMQLSALTGFVNAQMDALVIAAVLPIRYVGLYGIGMQVASAVRTVPLFVFAPLLTRFATTFRNHGREATAVEFERMERRWLPAMLGYGVVTVAAIGFAVPIWLGDRYLLSGLTAAILLVGYMVHVGLTGMRTCYVRAIGRPGLETRYSSVWTVTNAALTIPMALAGGLLGVVGATAATGVLASIYFVVLCRRTEQLPVIAPERRWWGLVAAAAGITVAGELAILQTDLHGFFPLALTAVPGLLAWLMLVTSVRRSVALRAIA
jgi:O-antigen/teichoic acid export membrane protein